MIGAPWHARKGGYTLTPMPIKNNQKVKRSMKLNARLSAAYSQAWAIMGMQPAESLWTALNQLTVTLSQCDEHVAKLTVKFASEVPSSSAWVDDFSRVSPEVLALASPFFQSMRQQHSGMESALAMFTKWVGELCVTRMTDKRLEMQNLVPEDADKYFDDFDEQKIKDYVLSQGDAFKTLKTLRKPYLEDALQAEAIVNSATLGGKGTATARRVADAKQYFFTSGYYVGNATVANLIFVGGSLKSQSPSAEARKNYRDNVTQTKERLSKQKMLDGVKPTLIHLVDELVNSLS